MNKCFLTVLSGLLIVNMASAQVKKDSLSSERENIMKSGLSGFEDEILKKLQLDEVSVPLKSVADSTEEEASFDFENIMKLDYTPWEEEILKKIQEGNVEIKKVIYDSTFVLIRDAQGIVKPVVLFASHNPGNCAQMLSLITTAVPFHYQQKTEQQKEEEVGNIRKKETQNETQQLIPTCNTGIQPEVGHAIGSGNNITKIPIASEEEKIRVFLQSVVDEEFLYAKKFDSTGFLNKYTTYGHGLHCPLFAKCCMDVFTDSAGILTLRIHDANEPIGWNCTGNYIFGNDSACIKSDAKSISTSFRYKKTSFVKYGNTVLFKLSLGGKEWGTETWEIVRNAPKEIILQKTEYNVMDSNGKQGASDENPTIKPIHIPLLPQVIE